MCCVCRYFSEQMALGRRREPDDDVDSDADEVSDDEFDAFLGKLTVTYLLTACLVVWWSGISLRLSVWLLVSSG